MITIKKTPETAGKLKVGTSSDTPADGEIIATKGSFVGANSGGDVTSLQLRNDGVTASTSTSLRFVNSNLATATNGGSELTSVRNTNDGGSLVFKTAANTSATLTERMRIDHNGLCTFAAGIALQTAASNASATAGEAFTLDKYETGTWTPVHAAAGSTSGTWNITLTGTYTRIGDLVSVNLRITGTSMDFSSVEGYRGYSGLPFPPASDGAGSYDSYHTTSTIGAAAVFPTGSTLYLHPAKIGTGTSVIYCTVTYKV